MTNSLLINRFQFTFSIGYFWIAFLGLIIFSFAFPIVTSAQSNTITTTKKYSQERIDRDLSILLTKLRKIKVIARSCASGECLNMPCSVKRELNKNVFDSDSYVKHAYVWNKIALKKNRAHWAQYVERQTADSERYAKLTMITGYQQYVVDIATTMADVGTTLDSLKKTFTLAEGLDGETALQIIDKLDVAYEGAKAIERATNRYKRVRGQKESQMFSLGNKEVDQMKSTLSNMKSIINDAYKNGTDWRKSARNGRGALGQIVVRYLGAYATSEIRERQLLLRKYESDMLANDRVMGQIFREAGIIAGNMNKLEDAHNLLKELLTRGDSYWLKCGNSSCTLTPEWSEKVPDYAWADLSGDQIELARVNDESNWGRSLEYLYPKISAVAQMSVPNPNENEARIEIPKTTFKPGENITVKFKAKACYSRSSWVGVIPSSVSHGKESLNFSKKVSNRSLLRGRVSGEMTIKAPDKEGEYDLRMNDIGSKKEVAYVAFKVEKEKSAARALHGLWKHSTFATKDWRFIVVVKGDSVTLGFGRYNASDQTVWFQGQQTGILRGNQITWLNVGYSTSCNSKTGDIRIIPPQPHRFVLTSDMQKAVLFFQKDQCTARGIRITNEWGYKANPFTKVSDNVPGFETPE